MDPDDWLQSPQPPTGSKRPSPSPSTGEDRETKKQRTQHCDNEDANRELPSREMPYRPVDFGEDGEVYSNESRAAFSVNVAYRDQFAISLADNDGGVSSFNNDIACGYPNTEHENESLWDVSTQKAFQGHEGHEGHVGTIASSEIGYSTDSATLVQPSKRTGAKDYLFKIEEPNSTGLASSYNDVNNAPLQGSAMQIQDESCDICCDYDTCFGVLMATPTSSFTPEDGTHTVPVKLKAFGDIFMLQTQTSCAHAGILSDSRLVNALTVFPLRIDATLLISEVEKIKGLTQSKSRKHTTEKSAPEYSLRIVIHGLRCDKEAISNTLSNANLFLQHPYASEVLPDVEYNNPHYLLRPGAEMPKVEDLHLEFEDDVSVQTGLEEESENDHLLRLLETAEADGGELTVVDTSPSPRLRHQVAALAFMLEKERGYVDLPMFPPLWRSEYFKDSHTLRHTWLAGTDITTYPRGQSEGGNLPRSRERKSLCNSLDDYGALLSFVGIYPFREKSKFSSWIVKPVKQKDFFGVQSFQTLVRATCLRRTKQKALSSGKLTLPPRSERTQIVRLHPDDQALYDRVTKATREKALKLDKHPQKGSSTKDKENNILVLLNFLRRICNHEQLLPASFKNMIEEGSSSNIDPQLQQIYRRECSACGGEINSSSSIKATLNSLSKFTKEPGQVYNHYWIGMLGLIEHALDMAGIAFQRIDGQTSLEGRRKALLDFNGRLDCTVMLASIGSAAGGIDLTAASLVHLIEPHWNPVVEAQAIDLVHRIGQTQEVTVIRYIVPNSIETASEKCSEWVAAMGSHDHLS
ncbi:uncharacterized protein J7T55_007248 [Diaporthe amygdali]|uniref:uncharacterized protein n=1 Tax=Phomopsis amygdali TaxID=1214568 RepID=UPI0022FDC13A|nr:uncharacterized protein J7T55_007248 [Diaporthe amygdali]KAJ0108129.1 uncharacterized protein J7T55_007248 [Diaporthe amygdali]